MNNTHVPDSIPSLAGTRRALLGGTLAAVTGWLSAPASDAKKKRKRKRKKKVGNAGRSPMQPNSSGEDVGCVGGVVVDGVCRPCDVCASGCGFATVQAAIDAATTGATITICPGTYAENLTMAKDVRLVGAGSGTGTNDTILKGTGTTSVVKTQTSNVVLQNLRITGGRGDGGGISNQGATLDVIGCTVSGNEAALGGGIFTIGRSGIVQLITSEIRGNTAINGGGIYVHDGAEVRFDAASRVTENTAMREGGGIFASTTAGRVSLVSSANVSGNTPSDCGGVAVDLCSGIVTRR